MRYTPVTRMVYFIIEDDQCIFDSGAKSNNFLCHTYVDEYIKILQPYITPCTDPVTLGDSVTTEPITQTVILTVSFLDNNNETHLAYMNLHIMPLGGV